MPIRGFCPECIYDPKQADNAPISQWCYWIPFVNGHTYCIPDLLPHYMMVHRYLPPPEFCNDVLNGDFIAADQKQASHLPHERVGFLDELPRPFSRGADVDVLAERVGRIIMKIQQREIMAAIQREEAAHAQQEPVASAG